MRTVVFLGTGGTGGTLMKVPPVYFLGKPASDPTDTAEPPNGFRLCNPRAPPEGLQNYFCLFIKFQQILNTKITLISKKHSSKSSTIKRKPFLHLNKPKANFPPKLKFKLLYLRNPIFEPNSQNLLMITLHWVHKLISHSISFIGLVSLEMTTPMTHSHYEKPQNVYG